MATEASGSGRWSAHLLSGLRPIERDRIPVDAIAGVTLAAMAIPQVLGYATIAGVPVVLGLYTLVLPVIAFAIFGSSRYLVVGADSSTAAMLAVGLLALGAESGSQTYVELAVLSALMCGVFLFGARLLRLGFIANFLSSSVLVGFMTGVGIQVAMGQVGGMFGITDETGRTVQKFLETLAEIPSQTSVPTLVVSITVLTVLVGLGRVNKAIPGALIVVIGWIAASYLLDLQAVGVTVVGPVSGGLPQLSLPTDVMTVENVVALAPIVVAMSVVILAQSAATSRAYALKHGDSFDENVDLVGLGMSNLGSGLSGTFVSNGSPTKTALVDDAGGRSQVSHLTMATIVVVVLLFLTGPLSYLPNAVLASLVFVVGLRLVDYRTLATISRLRPGEFAVAIITTATVVIFGVEQGILVALFLSIIEHLSHSYRPHDTLVGTDHDGAWTSTPLDARTQAAEGLTIYRFGANLYYANADRLTDEVMAILDQGGHSVQWLALSTAAMGDIDYTGAGALRRLADDLQRRGVTFVICEVHPRLRASLDSYGLIETIGAEHLFGSLTSVLEAYRSESRSSEPR